MQVETKIPPGGQQKGSVLLSPSITKEQFDARKDATITIEPYDQQSILTARKGDRRQVVSRSYGVIGVGAVFGVDRYPVTTILFCR